jgi:holo-[acyl-carrier protein] synthase
LVKGIGIDIVENERIEQAYARFGDRLLKRIFSPNELEIIGGASVDLQRAAARFAGKEAVYKALGSTKTGIRWQEIEILRDSSGKPVVRLSGSLALCACERGISFVHISLTHERKYAAAAAVAVGE